MTTHPTHEHALAIASQKGGVGKTTTATIAAPELAARGRRVLLIDLDPQAHSTEQAGVRPAPGQPGGTYQVIVDQRPLAEAVVRSPYGYDVLTSGADTHKADDHIRQERGEELGLRQAIAECTTQYDSILIDCPGFLTDLALAGLLASRSVLVPLFLEHLAVDGLVQTNNFVNRLVRRGFAPDLRIGAVLALRVDLRSNIAKLVHAELAQEAGGLLLRGTLRSSSTFSAAQKAGVPVTHYLPRSDAAQDSRRVVDELLERGLL